MKDDKKVILAYLAICIFWGSTYLGIKIGIEYFPPLTFAGIRFMIAGIIMMIYSMIKKYKMVTSIKTIVSMAVVGSLMIGGGNGFVTLAEMKVSSGIASLFVALVPIYIAIIEIIMLKSVRLSKSGYIGLVVGFIGVLLLINPFGSEIFITLEGVIMLILAGVLWSIGSVYSKKVYTDAHIVSNISVQMISGGILLFVLGIIRGEHFFSDVHMTGIYALIYLIIFGSIVGYSSYIYVLSKWPAAKAGTYAYVNPVVAVFLGYLILGENVTLYMVFSIILILTSVYMVQRSKII